MLKHMSKNKKKKIKGLNEGHYVEAIDRAYIVANMMEDVLIDHPVYEKHKELRKRVRKAQQLILEAYQIIGGLSVDLFPDPAQQAEKK
jgi:hypothetical protein